MESSAHYAQQMSSYKKKYEEFEQIKEKVSKLTSNVTASQEAVESVKKYTDQIIVLGEAMDGGIIANDVDANLKKINDNIETIKEECDRLIKKYKDLYSEAEKNYNAALKAEAEAAAAAARAQSAQAAASSGSSSAGTSPAPSSGSSTFGAILHGLGR